MTIDLREVPDDLEERTGIKPQTYRVMQFMKLLYLRLEQFEFAGEPMAKDKERDIDLQNMIHIVTEDGQWLTLLEARQHADRQEKMWHRTRPIKPSRRPRQGYVYILAGPNGAYKIGKTIDYHSRGRTFGIELPFDVSFECILVCQDYSALELELHQLFADKRIRGEWFHLEEDDLWLIWSCYSDRVDSNWLASKD